MSDTTAALTAEQQAAYDKGVTLLNEGKAEEASEVLSALLEAATGMHDTFSLVCAPIHLAYGRALLEQAQAIQDDIFGTAVKPAGAEGGEEEAAEEEEEEEEEAAGDAAAPAAEPAAAAVPEAPPSDAAEASPSAEAPPSASGGEGDGEEGEGEGEKEDSSERTELLQIAWEVVDVSRIVYAKFADKKKELADALLVLGEVCLESDNNTGAVEEFTKCLELREEIGDPRDGADVYALLALAFLTLAGVDTDVDSRKANYERAGAFYKRTRAALVARFEQAVQAHVPEEQKPALAKALGTSGLLTETLADEAVTLAGVVGAALPADATGRDILLDVAAMVDEIDAKVREATSAVAEIASVPLFPVAVPVPAPAPLAPLPASVPVNTLTVKRKPAAAPAPAASAEPEPKRAREAEQ